MIDKNEAPDGITAVTPEEYDDNYPMCTGCFYQNAGDPYKLCNKTGVMESCRGIYRKDGEDVIFKEEK